MENPKANISRKEAGPAFGTAPGESTAPGDGTGATYCTTHVPADC